MHTNTIKLCNSVQRKHIQTAHTNCQGMYFSKNIMQAYTIKLCTSKKAHQDSTHRSWGYVPNTNKMHTYSIKLCISVQIEHTQFVTGCTITQMQCTQIYQSLFFITKRMYTNCQGINFKYTMLVIFPSQGFLIYINPSFGKLTFCENAAQISNASK